MEEFTASIQMVAANRQRGEGLSQATLNVVEEGKESLPVQFLGQWRKISESTNQIAEIVEVVNDKPTKPTSWR